MISEKIKFLRKQAQLSQEQLAAQLNVSRQAVTKWETGGGAPDIGNLQALAALFGVSVDALLADRPIEDKERDFLFDSVTEYDVDGKKHYDIAISGAKQVALTADAGEKIRVRLASHHIAAIQTGFKVKIDDVKEKIDVNVRRLLPMTETKAKAELYIFIFLPQRYVKRVELSGHMESLTMQNIAAERMEFSGKARRIRLDGVCAHVELDSNQDMEIICGDLPERLDVNQISALSRLSLPLDAPFAAVTRGIANTILYEKEGQPAEKFSLAEPAAKCASVIELNGINSELTINAVAALPSAK